jgi:dipeptidyl aminopeptidase/acylaminoacyl peptidase
VIALPFQRPVAFALALAIVVLATPGAADEARYRTPPRAVLDVLNARPLPLIFVSPSRKTFLLATPLRYPPIADLARPMLRLAGMRIDPANNGIHHAPSFTSYELVSVSEAGKHTAVTLPTGAHAGAPVWSPDGSRFAFSNTTPREIDLYVGVTATGAVHAIKGIQLNTLFGNPIAWTPDGKQLFCYIVPSRRSVAPVAPAVPSGPVVDETRGVKAPAVTFEDLLTNPHDADLWEYYASGYHQWVDPDSRDTSPLSKVPEIDRSARLSPDGRHVIIDRIVRPYSYAVPWESFPHEYVEVTLGDRWTSKKLFALPAQTNAAGDVVPTGPRDLTWRPDKPATLVWTEAQDGGNPAAPAKFRDALRELDVTSNASPTTLLSLAGRFRGIEFIASSSQAFVRDYDRDVRVTRTQLVDLAAPATSAATLWQLRDGDRYHDPGQPATHPTANGESVVMRDGDAIFLLGQGYGPDGRRPFLDRFDLKSKNATRQFQSELVPLESVVAVVSSAGQSLLVSRQSATDPPNYFLRYPIEGKPTYHSLTNIADPTPQLRAVQRRVVSYKRPDGVDLSFTLYLPPGYKEGTRLPTLVWAYPAEFNDPSIAGQNTNSTQTFPVLAGASQIFAALDGYAVLDNAAVPIVGPPRTVNDTFVEQLVADATAAIDKAVAMGVTDPDRVAVGGHSYGAFMTANLLAHTRLFRAGIARSGAYNRSLTPFGFQNERRTYWEAPDLYLKMSPFTYADKIVDPLLMIHGLADDNTGTFPIQSERLFAAIRGNGGTARLVLLPYEAHGYVARESIETTLAEMLSWLDRYVKNAPPRTAAH